MIPSLHNPVIVLSAAVRSGTTLVQRLLCSAPNTLIFGDSVGQEMEFFAKYAAVKEQMLRFQESFVAPVRTTVLAGGTDDFITSLAPTSQRHLAGYQAAAFAWLAVCQEDALAARRPVWGWKLAGADAAVLPLLAAWFPEARWIWVERDLADCFRSAKAAGMMQGPDDAANFVQAAAAARAAFAPLRDRALVLDFHIMTADPAATMRQLESHTGACGIAERVFSVRVNQAGANAYVPPAALSAEEERALALPSIAHAA
jgi:hypothetical protein